MITDGDADDLFSAVIILAPVRNDFRPRVLAPISNTGLTIRSRPQKKNRCHGHVVVTV